MVTSNGVIRANRADFAWIMQISGESGDSRESEIRVIRAMGLMRYKIGVSIANDSRESPVPLRSYNIKNSSF